ncbi:MAG: PIN domain-containing protein [Deltaproteobacteria bacterium]|nr:PIN domain-containing protein [Deltaproteobacteria bacterium]MCZ6621896.1 PIN domain-containing protein [Deltaproteobacteria bacterium]MCZ6908210.1 PIN domain-containing protein [Deltaproteobacteria bacterium]
MTSVTANLAIIDSSVYIDNLRFGRFEKELLELKFLVRCSAVVLAELWRGARSREMARFVDYLARNFRIIAPNEREWVESGKVVGRIARAKGFDIHKTREIQFDVLIAMTARKIGACLITCDARDFTAIRQIMNFKLICW